MLLTLIRFRFIPARYNIENEINNLLTIWIRAPYALDEARCRAIGLDAKDLYQRLLTGAREIAKTLEKYSRSAEFLQISLP